jgi:hypothetical protein
MAHKPLDKSVVSLISWKTIYKKFEFLLEISFLAAKANSINFSAKRNRKKQKKCLLVKVSKTQTCFLKKKFRYALEASLK